MSSQSFFVLSIGKMHHLVNFKLCLQMLNLLGFAAGKNRKLEEKAEQMGYQSCQKTEQTSMLRGCVG